MSCGGSSGIIIPPTSVVLSGKNVYFFGDSITEGFNASIPAKRWTSLFSASVGCIETNNGIISSVLENRVPVNPLGGSNMVLRISTIPVKGINDALLVFMFGINDWGYNGTNYTVANYLVDYDMIINAAFSKGWGSSSILIMSPTYVSDLSFSTYAIASGNAAPNRAVLLNFIMAAEDIAIAKGTFYLDTYDNMLSNGGDSLISGSDGIHPNDAGYNVIAQQVINFFL